MRILLIEDDKIINQNIKDCLMQNGFKVDVAFDGFIGEKLIKRHKYDCIILDINLPYKNGYELCTEFRNTNIITPILMLTAYDEIEDKLQGFNCGADDYMTKPFYMEEILIRIRTLIKRVRNIQFNEDQKTISIDDLIINMKTKTVIRNNIEIPLTRREFEILTLLSRSVGEIVSKKTLIKEIWGDSFDVNDNTVEVNINFLRKKIDKPFGKQLIKTKIGFGYYLDI